MQRYNENRTGERLQSAMTLYENVRMVLERLRDVDAELDSAGFDSSPALERARTHLFNAYRELEHLADLARQMHLRPAEDSSDGVLGQP